MKNLEYGLGVISKFVALSVGHSVTVYLSDKVSKVAKREHACIILKKTS